MFVKVTRSTDHLSRKLDEAFHGDYSHPRQGFSVNPQPICRFAPAPQELWSKRRRSHVFLPSLKKLSSSRDAPEVDRILPHLDR